MASMEDYVDVEFNRPRYNRFKKPEGVHLPEFLNSDEKWNDIVTTCFTLGRFEEILDQIMGVNLTYGSRMDILLRLSSDIVLAQPFYNPFWQMVTDHFNTADSGKYDSDIDICGW